MAYVIIFDWCGLWYGVGERALLVNVWNGNAIATVVYSCLHRVTALVYCRLKLESDALGHVYSTISSHMKREIVSHDRGPSGSEEIQSTHLADALHALQSFEDHDRVSASKLCLRP